MNEENVMLQKITSLCKRRGFVFPSSEIYGGWEASYDFGPLGAEMLRNLRKLWWKEFVHKQENIVGIDGAIISHPKVWEASGHVESFADVMVEDMENHKRYRADHIIAEAVKMNADGLNPLVEVEVGTLESEKTKAYLRGETCQPIFYNYALVKDSMRKKLPFGIAQIGKAFRNEIKVGPFIHRTREFEQMELEMFVSPKDADKYFKDFRTWVLNWLFGLGLDKNKFRLREQEFKERAHYNKVAVDGEYEYDFGWKEFLGIHNRGDWDLKRHGEFSGFDFTYKNEESGESYIPNIVEFSIGLNRLMLVLLCDAYVEDVDRVVLKLDKEVAPFKAAVFPLVRNKQEIVEKAKSIFDDLRKNGLYVDWDDRGNIGKRYYSQDEIGTPYCITVDYQTLEDNTVTIRERDSMKQERVLISEILKRIEE